MKGLATVFMVVMLTTVTPIAFGQQKQTPMPSGAQHDDEMNVEIAGQSERGEPMSEEKRAEIRKKIETVRIWRLTEALKLDAGASAKLSSLLSSLDHQRRDIQREQMETLRMLRLSLNSPKPDESIIKTDLEKLEKNHRSMQDLKNNELSGLKNLLTIEQRARYIVFQHEFMREMRGMIHGARGTGRSGTGTGPGGGPGMGGGQMRGGTPEQTPAN